MSPLSLGSGLWQQGRGLLQVWEAWERGTDLPGRNGTFELQPGPRDSEDLGTERKCGHGGSLPPSPSLAPLTELNELSILSVLDESSWERARGQGEEEGAGREERETKAKNLAPTWTVCFSCVALLSPPCFNEIQSTQTSPWPSLDTEGDACAQKVLCLHSPRCSCLPEPSF